MLTTSYGVQFDPFDPKHVFIDYNRHWQPFIAIMAAGLGERERTACRSAGGIRPTGSRSIRR